VVFRFRFDERDAKAELQNCIVKTASARRSDMDLELSKSLFESQFVVGKAPSQRTFLVQLMTKHAIVSNVSLNALADLVRLSPYHFLRCFKRSFGEPPQRYWTRRRIEHAKSLLGNPRASITEIALDVGFSATSAFSATFHRNHGTDTNGLSSRTRMTEPPPAGRSVDLFDVSTTPEARPIRFGRRRSVL
jgi:AraC-like DNA-binding protein